MHSAPATDSPPAAPTINAIEGWRKLALLPLGLLVRAWGASLRFELDPVSLANLTRVDRPVIFALWHNRLFLVSEIFRRYRRGHRLYGLVSASKDGAWLSALFALVGLNTIRGSSSKLGREAVMSLVNVLKQGDDIGITPDGPRGPLYVFKPGSLIVARRTAAPIMMLGAHFTSSWQLRSWDRFYLPKPFSTVHLRCIEVDASELKDRDEASDRLQQLLCSLNRPLNHSDSLRII